MVESCFLAKKEKTFDFSKVFILVEVTGFEPATFWSRRALTNSPLSESAILLISPQVFHNSVGLQRRFYAVFRVFSPNFSPQFSAPARADFGGMAQRKIKPM